MTPEHYKLINSIEKETDIEKLKIRAIELVKTLICATTSKTLNNYRVVNCNGEELETGSKNYCIGYTEARNHYISNEYGGNNQSKVLCDNFEIWPNWGGEE